MEQLNIAVCEDDRADLQHLCRLITANGASANVSAFETGEDFLAACQPDRFDLIFMDIYLDGLNGVETVRRVRSMGITAPVAFITISEDFAMDSYRLDVEKYIEKPARQEKVDESIALALRKKEERRIDMIVWGRREPVELETERKAQRFRASAGEALVFPLSQELPGQSEFRPEHRQRANGIPNEGGRKRLHSPGNLLPGQGRLGELAVHIGAGKGGSD